MNLSDRLCPQFFVHPMSQQRVVYSFKCRLWDTEYIGYTCRHLHQRIEEHKSAAIGKHLQEKHNAEITDLGSKFSILKRCKEKLDCLIYEMLFIRERKPELNTQSDSIPRKVFV